MADPDAGAAGTLTIGGELEVHRLGFGAMRITGDGVWGPPADPDGARAVLRRAIELGVDFIDTADSYGPEVSERLIGETLAAHGAAGRRIVVATKGGFTRPGPGRWDPDGRPEHLRAACEASLRRLGVERIDLYQHHVPDAKVPYEESIGALAALQAEGKIRHLGVSNVSVEQLETALSVAPIVSVQNRYSLTDRDSEPVLEQCERRGIAFIPWFPLAAGRITEPGGPLDQVAEHHGASRAQIAIAWLLARSPVMLPIPGTQSLDHLEENVAAAALALDDEDLAALAP